MGHILIGVAFAIWIAAGCATSREATIGMHAGTSLSEHPLRFAVASTQPTARCVDEEAFDKSPKDWTRDDLTVRATPPAN